MGAQRIEESVSSNLPEALLSAEFHYLTQAAFQANEDRARSSQFFLLTFGTFIAGLFSVQRSVPDPQPLNTALAFAFALLTLFGVLTNLQLARLRQAWLESARAMNQLKAHWGGTSTEFERTFRWRQETLPAAFNPKSLGFLQAVTVSLLSGLAAGASIGFSALASGSTAIPWTAATFAGLAALVVALVLGYWLPLRRA